MRVGAAILGMLGALGALGIGQLAFGAGSLMGQFAALNQTADEIQVLSVGIPLVGLLGSGLIFRAAKLGGALMLLSCAGILFTLGFNVVSMGIVMLLGLGGVLALFAPAEHTSPST